MARKSKIGRPKKPANEVREIILKIRVSKIENAAFAARSKAVNGGEISTWAREVLRRECGMKPE